MVNSFLTPTNSKILAKTRCKGQMFPSKLVVRQKSEKS